MRRKLIPGGNEDTLCGDAGVTLGEGAGFTTFFLLTLVA